MIASKCFQSLDYLANRIKYIIRWIHQNEAHNRWNETFRLPLYYRFSYTP